MANRGRAARLDARIIMQQSRLAADALAFAAEAGGALGEGMGGGMGGGAVSNASLQIWRLPMAAPAATARSRQATAPPSLLSPLALAAAAAEASSLGQAGVAMSAARGQLASWAELARARAEAFLVEVGARVGLDATLKSAKGVITATSMARTPAPLVSFSRWTLFLVLQIFVLLVFMMYYADICFLRAGLTRTSTRIFEWGRSSRETQMRTATVDEPVSSEDSVQDEVASVARPLFRGSADASASYGAPESSREPGHVQPIETFLLARVGRACSEHEAGS